MFHLEWDSLNNLITNIHESNVVNSTGGIMIQEVKPGFDPNNHGQRVLPQYNRSKIHSIKVGNPKTLEPIHIYIVELGQNFLREQYFSNQVYSNSINKYYVWLFA